VIFEPTSIPGAFVIRIEQREDERGYFARVWCREEFAAHGIDVGIVQASVSHNRQAGTLRGMHFTWPPSREAKLVRCEHGRVHDVILDLRPKSPTFLRHLGFVLDAQEHNALYIPHGVAHGFQTMTADADVLYMMTDSYRPTLAAGARFDDPVFGIAWPLPVTVISDRDRTYPDFNPASHSQRLIAGPIV
jgi:dTDP-4-dehydrorhamnose 3,5-epimerase